MSESNEAPLLTTKPDDKKETGTSLPRTIISLFFFVVLYYWLFQSWTVVIALVVVLLIHESGHFIAMKLFGYKSVNMTFVPFVGAFVSGEATNLSNRNKLIVLLAGPLPGIIIGIALLLWHHYDQQHLVFVFAIIFLLQNTFNLLPVFPLDGGQFFQALFFNGGRIMQLVFLYLSLAAVVFIAYRGSNWTFLIFTLPLIFKIRRTYSLARVHKRLDETGVDYACGYEDLTDDEYWTIRNIVIEESSLLSRKYTIGEYADNEQDLIPFVEAVLVPPFEDTLTLKHKLFFVAIWVVFFASPVLLWCWHKGIL